jgi:hypothetical protein
MSELKLASDISKLTLSNFPESSQSQHDKFWNDLAELLEKHRNGAKFIIGQGN